MSTENASPESGSSGESDQRIQQVQNQVVQLQAALSATKQTRNLLVLSLLAVLAVAGVLFYQLGSRLQDEAYQTALGEAAQKYLEQNTGEYMREVQTLVDHVGPVVSDAFMTQVKQDTPLYTQAIDRQRELLMENLEERLALAINDHYDRTLDKYEDIIVQEFPAADDETVRRQVMENFRVSLNGMVKEFYIDEFRTELQTLYDTWDGFPIASVPDEGDLPLEDQLFGTLLNLLALKVSSSGVDVAADVESAAGTSTTPPESDTPPDPDTATTPEPTTPAPAEKPEAPPESDQDADDSPAETPNDATPEPSDAAPTPDESDSDGDSN